MTGTLYVKRFLLGVAALAGGAVSLLLPLLLVGLVGSGIAQVAGATPSPPSQFCGGAIVWGNGGYQCDGAPGPDGSFQRCTTVYVLGIGGTSCYIVYP